MAELSCACRILSAGRLITTGSNDDYPAMAAGEVGPSHNFDVVYTDTDTDAVARCPVIDGERAAEAPWPSAKRGEYGLDASWYGRIGGTGMNVALINFSLR